MTSGIGERKGRRRASPARRECVLGPMAALTCEDVERVALDASVRAAFSDETERVMAASASALRAVHERGDPVYGLTTGFGPLVVHAASADAREQGAGLIAHLAAGHGPCAPAPAVRAVMLVRCATLARGMSGVDPAVARGLLAMLNGGVCPLVPEVGSVGASGDLIPLAHVARTLCGEGEAMDRDGRVVPAAEALAQAGIEPMRLTGRDALALVNGTAFMTAYAALATARGERLLARAESITGWIYRLLGARAQALDERLHLARGHDNQARSARAIREEAAAEGPWEDPSRPLQEVYSFRCAPQFLGACRDNLDHARRIVEREMAGVNDNPLILGGPAPAALHGGNFQGQQVAFASDALNAALTQAAVLAERQLDVLLNPALSGGAPPMLAWSPGATSGLAGAQITATALVAEMRQHGGPAATSSIPTNGRNQDVVSMGTMAARLALGQTDRLASVLAITAIGASQLAFLRERGRAPGRAAPAPAWAPRVEGVEMDRPLRDDIARVAQAALAV